MTDRLWDDIAEWLRPYAQFRSELLASSSIGDTGAAREDLIEATYYEHIDYVDLMRENMVAAIVEAAAIALAVAQGGNND